jgi:type IV fimbrial biogenesis protein FimT
MFRIRTSGFSLVELMIALAIAAMLLVLAIPSYSVWVADSQIRNAAESIAGGMRFAQGEALKRNSQVAFVLDPTTATGGWTVQFVTDATVPTLQAAAFREGADKTAFVTVPANARTVTFTGLGQIGPNANGTPALTQVQVATSTGVAGTRNLNVLVGGNRTGIKICDPKWPATDPKGCPP